ncbi:PKD domain-containing protein [Foetidibacter luteolus]|uniref:PKD domain-containing protein n=1 Tax=Foetidibacter luteolus TaxID=2608880 RepID=UPI0027B9BCBC|nr:PKD domain-containing protein [Foetidibacter luteolus]
MRCASVTLLLCFVCSFVWAQPKAAFTANITSGCPPLVVQFQDNSTGNPTGYRWDLGNGDVSTEQNPGAIYVSPGTYNVKLVVTGADGKDSLLKTGYIVVYALPAIDFSAATLTGCAPLEVVFTDKSTAGSGSIVERIWDFGDGKISTSTNPSTIYIVADTFSVALTLRNSFGCRQTVQLTDYITVNGGMQSGFSYSYINACKPPTPVSLVNETTPLANYTYQWLFGDGSTASSLNPSYTYTRAGDFNVQLITSDEFGCSDTAAKTISIGTVKADFSLPANTCVNGASVFTNASAPRPTSATWYFGDGSTATGIDASHSFKSPGDYTVKLVADFGSCVDSITKTITISNKPVIAFNTIGTLETCTIPNTVQFTNTSTGASAYQWYFGDGGTALTANASHTYTEKGDYDVKLVAVTDGGCTDSLVKKALVKIGPPKITKFQNLPAKVCLPATVKFEPVINSPEPITTYVWSFGDGTTSNEASPSHAYTLPGSYTVSLIATTASGCADTLKYANAVVAGEKPKAAFSADPLESCARLPIKFKDLSTGKITDWFWNFGDGTSSTLQNPSHIYKDTGHFSITLTVMSAGCEDSVTIKEYIHIKPPVSRFTTVVDCSQPYFKQFTNRSIDATSYTWNFGDGNTSTEFNPKYTYAKPGNYRVKLSVANGQCTDEYETSVLVIDEKPGFSYTAQSAGTDLCRNDSVVFTANNYNIDNIAGFSWVYGDGSTSGFGKSFSSKTYRYTKTGSFEPMLVTRDVLGCRDTVKKAINFNVYGPDAAFVNDAGTCINGSIEFTDKTKTDGTHPITQWIWSYGDGQQQTIATSPVSHQYTTADSFDVKLTVKDAFGCVDSVTKRNAVIITQPLADFKPRDSIRCTSSSVGFTNLSEGLDLTYKWYYGNGKQGTTKNPGHTYAAEGIYTVALKVTDRFGCTDSITKANIVTISNPRAAFTVTDTFATCPPLLIEPVNTSSGYSSVSWNFADGNTSDVYEPEHLFPQGGDYKVTLVAQGFGNCTDTASQLIVLKGPSGRFTYPKLDSCAPASVPFVAEVKNTTTYIWGFGDGVTITAGSSTKHTYKEAGNYLPNLVLIDNNNCKVGIAGKDTLQIAGIKAAFVPELISNCDSAVIRFRDSSLTFNDEATTYNWVFGDGTVLNNRKNPAHAFNATGNYTVRLVVNSKLGCRSTASMEVNTTVNPSPKITITAPDSVCVATAMQFASANADATPATYKWLFAGNDTSALQNPGYTYATAGSYTASLIATNTFGCADTADHPLLVLNPPTVNAGADNSLCLGQTTNLQATGATTYQWAAHPSLSCTNCAAPMAAPDTATTYYVTGTTVAGCSATDSVLVSVKMPLQLTVSAGDTLCVGQKVQLTASGAETYQWQPASLLTNPNSFNPEASPATTTTFTVTGSDNQGCFKETATVTITVYPKPSFNIIDSFKNLNIGLRDTLRTTASADVSGYRWEPATWLSCTDCPNPVTNAQANITYTAIAYNPGGCTATDQVTISVLCNNTNIFIPNTFSPNNDGANDYFFPRGADGYFSIKSMRIFNRWGQMIFERNNFKANDQSQGWNGIYNGRPQASDVYIYMIDIVCDNGNIFPMKGNVTLLR